MKRLAATRTRKLTNYFILLLLGSSLAQAAVESNVRATKHNLSATSGNSVKATSESQVCVFCHTPHAATEEPNSPLWNRQLSPNATYNMYESLSIDYTDVISAPGGSSKLCLSCHDGTVTIGSVNVNNGVAGNIAMDGTSAGKMPTTNSTTGFTRNLGTELSNDHPISFTFDTTLATKDGELRDPATSSHLGDNLPGDHPTIPLQNGKVQCTSCHDPHLFDSTDPNRKFLRANRTQKVAPTGGAFNEANDIICLACHDKAAQAWSMSVHANSTDANETYTDAAADLREFPRGMKVWQASCLNCHDTHTVQGSRRLLREGVEGAGGITFAKAGGGNAAIEETCYQCHQTASTSVLNLTSNNVPNIKSDFTDAGNVHMPITGSDQQHSGAEIHDIENADFTESQANTGQLDLRNRHVECTDCHNPHRVMKSDKFNDTGSEASGTHNHATGHTNIASGALKGSVGVEPIYTNPVFNSDHLSTNTEISYELKKGVPGPGSSEAVSSSYVTREYQVCLRCHSDYGFGDIPPSLGQSTGGTPSGTNNVTQLTNQAMEFQAPDSHKGETGSAGYSSGYSDPDNHRSWHPVMEPTGRTHAVRGTANSRWLAPWNDSVGTQTMYCTDCHGNNTAAGSTTPETGKPWGPHGSSNNFILKGPWDAETSGSTSDDQLCFRCHNTNYLNTSESGTGFWNPKSDKGKDDLHAYHKTKSDNFRCTACHVALPHGWKNKAFLVNLNDIGPEGGELEGTNVSGNAFSFGPYYKGSRLRVLNWRKSGVWREADCGKSSSNNGIDWMKDSCG